MIVAADRLVEENMGLVIMIARRYDGRGVDFEDLVQIGSVGLVKAAKRFDPNRNLKFSTYAVSKIVGEIKTYFRDNGSVKISRTLKERSFKVNRIREQLYLQLQREPSIGEIAECVGLCPEEISECLESQSSVLSLDCEMESGGYFSDMIGEDFGDENIMKFTVRQALDCLQGAERELIIMRYFLDLTQSETAARLGISQVSVSRQEKNILKKLLKMIS